jgi:hypothetical protein
MWNVKSASSRKLSGTILQRLFRPRRYISPGIGPMFAYQSVERSEADLTFEGRVAVIYTITPLVVSSS